MNGTRGRRYMNSPYVMLHEYCKKEACEEARWDPECVRTDKRGEPGRGAGAETAGFADTGGRRAGRSNPAGERGAGDPIHHVTQLMVKE